MSEIAKSQPTNTQSFWDKFKEFVRAMEYTHMDYQIDRMDELELRIVQLEREMVKLKEDPRLRHRTN